MDFVQAEPLPIPNCARGKNILAQRASPCYDGFMFERFFSRAPRAGRNEDNVWLSDAARMKGLQKLAGEFAAQGQRALFVTRSAEMQTTLHSALESLKPATIDRFLASGLDAALESAGALVIASAEALIPPRPVQPQAVEVVIVTRAIDRRQDDQLVAFADQFGKLARITFHLSMQDAVLVGQRESLAPLLKALHAEDSEALAGGLLSRSIARMQAKLHKRGR
jgi:hypothetical protein